MDVCHVSPAMTVSLERGWSGVMEKGAFFVSVHFVVGGGGGGVIIVVGPTLPPVAT